MDSTNVYAYISIIALLFCLPPAVLVSFLYNLHFSVPLVYHQTPIQWMLWYVFLSDWGSQADAVWIQGCNCQSGSVQLSDLFWIGMFYHLYNQVCCSPSLNLYVPQFPGVQNSDCIQLIFLIFFPNEHISIQLSRASFNTNCSNSNAI